MLKFHIYVRNGYGFESRAIWLGFGGWKMIKRKLVSNLPELTELEERTANDWLQRGTIAETSRGEENTYYRDEFENQFYCKNYPK